MALVSPCFVYDVRLVLSLLLLALVNPAFSLTTFNPTCSLPPDNVHFVSKPTVRSTLEIVWSCLFTLLICTWRVQHLNVPKQVPKPLKARLPKPGIVERVQLWLMKKWRKTMPKLKWMALTLILPEFIFGRAYQEWLMARKSCKEMNEKYNSEDEPPWTTTHAFYANMGGFIVRKRSHGEQDIVGNCDEFYYLNARSISLARSGPAKPFYLQRLPKVSEDDLEDKSKGDFFVKATAFVQVLWFIIQVGVRAGRQLVISQLEFAVIAYAACFFVTHYFWYSKPQDVQISTELSVTEVQEVEKPKARDILDSLQEENPRSWFTLNLHPFSSADDIAKIGLCEALPNDARYDNVTSKVLPEGAYITAMDDGFVLGGVIFGALHCAAWNSPFPNTTEQLLWKISGVVSAGVLPLYYVISICRRDLVSAKASRYAFRTAEMLCVVAYLLARLYLLVEMFRTVAFLPPKAFTATWASNIPHV